MHYSGKGRGVEKFVTLYICLQHVGRIDTPETLAADDGGGHPKHAGCNSLLAVMDQLCLDVGRIKRVTVHFEFCE